MFQVSDYATIQQINSEFSRLNANNDVHSIDSSFGDRINQLGSEDELSTGSGNMSPRMRRAIKQINNQTAGYSSTRNQSPRSLNVETKLRAGVAPRSSNRNSANLTTNLQEELLRLINPDTMEGSSEQRLTKDVKTHSKENLISSSLSVHKIQPDINLR